MSSSLQDFPYAYVFTVMTVNSSHHVKNGPVLSYRAAVRLVVTIPQPLRGSSLYTSEPLLGARVAALL